jgi:hypothetical protein
MNNHFPSALNTGGLVATLIAQHGQTTQPTLHSAQFMAVNFPHVDIQSQPGFDPARRMLAPLLNAWNLSVKVSAPV